MLWARQWQERQLLFRLKVMEIGTCRPLQVNCKMHPEGTPTGKRGVMESPHVVRVIISAKEHSFAILLLLYTMSVPRMLLEQAHLTLISGLCCSRCQTAVLQPRPPERNAFRTWVRDKERGNSSISGGILFVNNLWMKVIVWCKSIGLHFLTSWKKNPTNLDCPLVLGWTFFWGNIFLLYFLHFTLFIHTLKGFCFSVYFFPMSFLCFLTVLNYALNYVEIWVRYQDWQESSSPVWASGSLDGCLMRRLQSGLWLPI